MGLIITKTDGTSIIQGNSNISPYRYIDIEVGKIIN